MRYAKAVDANHQQVLKAFTANGCTVEDYSKAGGGIPDLRVHTRAWAGSVTFWVEVKDGSKPPPARRLTPAQVEWRQRNPHEVVADVLCVEDVAALLGNLRNPMRRTA